MEFAFQYKLNNEFLFTVYSPENQRRIRDAFNANMSELKIYHNTENGSLPGIVAKHLINFTTKQVTNMDNRIIYRFVLL
uniref:Uncharacterized protein n=1 Tax=viral metagenome TaxID=1070528 RepID=A0A6C0JNX3_9ZZZZ